jgi:DNA-directed RNA polymerase subunit M
MKFCPKDKSLMVPRKVGGKTVYKCPVCGYEEEASPGGSKLTQTIKHSEKEKTLIIDQEVPAGAQKIKGIVCPACGNDEAYFWILQTRRADEPPTRFYKCTRCGKVWREYE